MSISTLKQNITQSIKPPLKSSNAETTKEKKHGQDDIFLKAPLRPFAYSNEVGAAIEPLIGHSAALMSYFPAMLYIGADCYDKYLRGDNDDYQKPSAERLTKEIIFQGFASVFMPTLCIHAGQNLACSANKLFGDKLDARAKNEIGVFLKEQALNFDLTKDKEASFAQLCENMSKKIENYRQSKQTSGGTLKKYWKKFTSLFNEALSDKMEFKHCGNIDTNSNSYTNLKSYAKKQFDNMYDIMKSLDGCDTGSVKGIMDSMEKNGKKISKYKATKLFNKIQKYAKDPSIGTERAKKLAIADMARDDINMKSLKGGPLLLAVIAGFATLFIAAPLLDKFGEEVLIKRVVDPVMDYGKRFQEAFKATNASYKTQVEKPPETKEQIEQVVEVA